MKICINQYAFIATILCLTTALRADHQIPLLVDKAQMIENELNTLAENFKTLKTQNDHAQQYDYKNKNLSAKQHHKIRSLQSSTQKALDQLNGKIKTVQHFLETTLEQLKQANTKAQSHSTQAITHFSELSDLNN